MVDKSYKIYDREGPRRRYRRDVVALVLESVVAALLIFVALAYDLHPVLKFVILLVVVGNIVIRPHLDRASRLL